MGGEYHVLILINSILLNPKSQLYRWDFFIFALKLKINNMDFNFMLQAHRGFAYLILLATAVFVIALLATMFGYSGKITKLLRKSTLFTMIFFHTQALIGLIMLFFFSPGFKAAKEAGTLMKDAVSRNTYVEHPTAMIVAAVLLTILNKKFKTNDRIQMSWVIMAFIAIALMLWAFQWHRLFGA